jgi:DNA sulfur modification protein DndD
MRIEQVRVVNFGALHDIDLDLSSSNPDIAFVNGSNGRGKTTFLDAIKWCFYGEEPKANKFLSRFALRQADPQSNITIRVIISVIMDNDGTIATVDREQTFQKSEEDTSRRIGQTMLTIQTRKSRPGSLTDTLSEVDAEKWLNHYFPKRLLNFFLFNGELMARFFDLKVKDNIEGAIRQIARVDHFENIADSLEEIAASHNRKISKLVGAKSEKIAIDLEEHLGLLRKLHDDASSDKIKLTDARDERRRKASVLEGKEGIEKAVEELTDVESNITRVSEDLARSEEAFQNEILANGVLGMLSPSISELSIQIELAKKEDRLPPPWDPERIRLLLKNEKCICGNHLKTDGEGAKELAKLIEKHQVSSIVGKQLSDLGKKASEIEIGLQSGWKVINVHNSAFVSSQTELTRLINRKTELLDLISEVDISEVSNAASEIKRLDKEIENLISSISALEVKGLFVQGQVSKLQRDLDTASAGNDAAQQLKREAKFAREVAEAARTIHIEAIKKVRERIEESFNSKFGSVKGGNFKSVITEDFEIVVRDEYGHETELSEGEKMMQAYAFSMTLREVINLNFPLIVDTPFGRLDGQNRKDLAKKLVDFLKSETTGRDFQAIFMMHDLEYTPYTKNYFAGLNPHEAFLGSDPKNPTVKSILGQGIDPDWLEREAWKDWAEGKI